LGIEEGRRLTEGFAMCCQISPFSAPVAQPVNFLDNPNAPDVFADAAAGFFNFAGNIRISLESVRVNHITTPGPMNRVVLARLVMPMDAAEALARGLLDFIAQQRTQQNPPPQTATGTVH
jgi:hypothetical protein